MGVLPPVLVTLETDPFWYGYWDGVEVPDYFPDISHLERMGDGGSKKYNKFHLKNRHTSFRHHVGPWKPLFDELCSQGFRDECVKRFDLPKIQNWTQIEFSAMPANGGHIWEHPDTASKVITFVLYAGGYPAPLECKGKKGWEAIPWKVGRMCFFVKNDESWHRVSPIKGPEGEWRQTITINLHRL